MHATPTRQEHTRSYYAATANDPTTYPELQGAHRADVCLVGGGFTGISTALTLAERGYNVAVVEANRVGWGASGRNGGQLISGVSGEHKVLRHYGPDVADMVWRLRWRGNEIIRERVEKYAIDCDFKPGYLEVALKSRHMRALEEDVEEYQRRGYQGEYHLFGREETRALVGSSAYIGSFLTMENGHLHPLNLCMGEARAASGLGVRIFEQSPVTQIEHGARPKAITEAGQVEADAIVLAGNAYHRLEGKRLSGLTFPAGSYIIATEPLPGELRQQINPRDFAICDLNDIVDYYRLSGDGRMLYGGRCNYSGRVPPSIEGAIRPRMEKIYPQLKSYRVEYEWGGNIGIVITRVPLVGRIGNNVWYAQGYSGHGVNASHIMGEILSDAITGTMEAFDLFARMPQIRLPGSQWFGNQIVALGMLYYRLKDLR